MIEVFLRVFVRKFLCNKLIWIHAIFKHYFCYGKQVFWIGK